jgi:hypothetical protein
VYGPKAETVTNWIEAYLKLTNTQFKNRCCGTVSGAFLTPGSGMSKKSGPGSRRA